MADVSASVKEVNQIITCSSTLKITDLGSYITEEVKILLIYIPF